MGVDVIEVKYKCACMSTEAEVMVRERAPGEDAPAWLQSAVVPEISRDHRRRSPLCVAAKVDHLLIPIQDDVPVGSVRRH